MSHLTPRVPAPPLSTMVFQRNSAGGRRTNQPARPPQIWQFSNIQFTNGGNYVLVVTNPVGSATSTAGGLAVIALPAIVRQPANQAAAMGRKRDFPCGRHRNPAVELSVDAQQRDSQRRDQFRLLPHNFNPRRPELCRDDYQRHRLGRQFQCHVDGEPAAAGRAVHQRASVLRLHFPARRSRFSEPISVQLRGQQHRLFRRVQAR